MSERTFDDLSDVLDHIIGQHGESLCVLKLGRIERYDATARRADVQPIYQRVIEDDLGERAVSDPVLSSVPVIFMGVVGASIVFTPARGDLVLLLFADHSLDRVDGTRLINPLATRDPGSTRAHHIADAIAIPVVLGKGTAAIDVKRDGRVHVGGDEPLALQSKLEELRDHVASLPVGGAGSAPVLAPSMGSGTSKLRG